MFRKLAKGIVLLLVLGVAGAWVLWPDGYVVNGPMFDFITGKQVGAPSKQQIANRLKVPEGFKIGVYAEKVPNARMMRTTGRGDLLVSSARTGNVILLHADDNGDGRSDGRTILASGLDTPHGLAIWNGYLYIAETHQIIRMAFDDMARIVGPSEVVFEGLPAGGNHSTRTIGFGPDDFLYVTTGSSCNVCIEEHPYRAAMLRMNLDGSDAIIYATGLRNTVGFDWQPNTGRLYSTDNGRDLLGDDTPHCEINHIEEGAFYGWPFTYDNKAVDPDFGAGKEAEIAASREMVLGVGAHVAPLGIKFFKPAFTPKGYEGSALVALHGSWNRSVLSGYKVISVHFNEDGSAIQKDFLTGFELDEDVIGRPVDIEQGLDGSVYISDDYSGTIYRIGWGDIQVSSGTIDVVQTKDALASLSEEERISLVQKGKTLYDASGCAACHDPEQAAEGVQVKLLDKLGRFDLIGLTALLDTPPGPMPRPDITDEDRRALAVYLLAQP